MLSNIRTSLSQKLLDDLMLLKINLPTLDKFCKSKKATKKPPPDQHVDSKDCFLPVSARSLMSARNNMLTEEDILLERDLESDTETVCESGSDSDLENNSVVELAENMEVE